MNYKVKIVSLTILALTTGGFAVSEGLEPNGTPGSATPFNIGDTLTGNFTNDGEGLEDTFGPFTAISGRTYRFVGSVTNGSSPGMDLALGTVNGSNALVGGAETDAGGVNAQETRNFVAPGTGPYYVYVREATAFVNAIQIYSVTSQLLPLAAISDWNLY